MNSTSIASNVTPNSWSVTLASGNKLNVIPPVSANLGPGYEVRYKVSAGVGISEPLNLYIRMPRGAARTFGTNLSVAPDPGLTWQIFKGGTSLATNTATFGWSVFFNTGTLKLTLVASSSAALSATGQIKDYEVRYRASGGATYSGEFDIVMSRVDVSEISRPAWAEPYVPTDSFSSGGKGPSVANSVNLATGVFTHQPEADIEVKNPVGPNASFSRICKTSMAMQGVGAQELAQGWRHNYDVSLFSLTAGSWSSVVRLSHANGAYEDFTPTLSGGLPTDPNPFVGPAGAPYFLEGKPSGTVGTWTELRLKFRDMSQYTFTLISSSYRLTKISNRMGRYISINRDGAGRVTSVVNDSVPSLTLLTFTLDGNGRITQILDKDARIVKFTYTTFGSITVLQKASQIGPNGTTPPSRWEYSYKSVNGKALLLNTSAPSAATNGANLAVQPMQIDTDTGRVQIFTDATGNRRIYTYNSDNTTRVNIWDIGGLAATQSFTAKYDGNTQLSTGFKDDGGGGPIGQTYISYTDPVNPLLPTQLTNRNGQSVSYTYDAFGNLRTSTDKRGVLTTIDYDYTINPLGLPITVTVGSKAPSKIFYYSNGLVYQVKTPRPGNVGDPMDLVISEENTYTALGNLLTRKTLNSSGIQVTTTYTYDSPEALGEPMSITEPGELGSPRTTFFDFDARGRMTGKTDARATVSGDPFYTEIYDYNDGDQLVQTTYPKADVGNPLFGRTVLSYNGVGLDPYQYQIFDENGSLVRTRKVQRGLESQISQAQSDAIPQQVTLDGLYRTKQALDGNNNATSVLRDNRGFITQIIFPAGDPLKALTFDAEGNVLTRQIGSSSIVVKYVRAPDDSRVTRIEYGQPVPSRAVDFVYDLYDRVTQITDPTGTTIYTYDDLDNVLTTEYHYTGVPNLSVNYTYNPNGSRLSMGTPFGSYAYTYNDAGEVKTIATPWSQSYTYTYDKGGRIKKQETPKDDTLYSYNHRGWISSLNHIEHGTLHSYSAYSSTDYDGVGNLIHYNATGELLGLAKPIDGTADLEYSPTDDISSYKRTFSYAQWSGKWPAPANPVTWTHDNNGNVSVSRGAPQARGTINQITETGWLFDTFMQVMAAPAVTVDSFNHKREAYTFTRDEDFNVTQVNKGGSLAFNAQWRGDGKRAWKDDGTKPRVYYIYDGDQPIAEVFGDGSLYAQYSYGPAGMVQRNTPSKTYTYGFDIHGSLALRYDTSTGSGFAQVAVYDPKGLLVLEISQNGTTPIPFDPVGPHTQQGAWTDEQTKGTSNSGICLVGKRYYDPVSCTFLTRDERFGNAYSDGDDGSGVIMSFQILSMIPVVGAPFNLAMAVYDFGEGDYVGGSLGLASTALDAVGIGAASEGISAARGARTVGEGLEVAADGRKAAEVGKSAMSGEEIAKDGIVYIRRDLTGGLKPYVGQAKSPERFAARQTEHALEHPGAIFEFDILGQAKQGEALDYLEDTWIRRLGEPTTKKNPNGTLSNRRYQMSLKRRKAFAGTLIIGG